MINWTYRDLFFNEFIEKPEQDESPVNVDPIKYWIRDISKSNNESIRQTLTRFNSTFRKRFVLKYYYQWLMVNGYSDFIEIGRNERNISAVIHLITESILSYDDIIRIYPQFDDHHKVYLQTYMINNEMITNKQYKDAMIGLCGLPILNSKLIGSTFIARNYLQDHVYTVFYNKFRGKVNYKDWVGFSSDLKGKRKPRPTGIYVDFPVTISKRDDITYLIDVMQAGINYKVRFGKAFINRSNMECLIDTLNDNFKPADIPTELKDRLSDAVAAFNSDELIDLDNYVFKLRNISKSNANRIASKHKDACVGYTTYKGL